MSKRSTFKARFKRQLLVAFLCVMVAMVFDPQRFQPLGRGIVRVILDTVIIALGLVFIETVVNFIFEKGSQFFKLWGDSLLGRDGR